MCYIIPGWESGKAEAVFENGILTLTIPKSEQVKPKSIKVKAKGAIEGKKWCYFQGQAARSQFTTRHSFPYLPRVTWV